MFIEDKNLLVQQVGYKRDGSEIHYKCGVQRDSVIQLSVYVEYRIFSVKTFILYAFVIEVKHILASGG